MFRRCQKQYSFRYDTAEALGLDPSREMVTKRPRLPLRRGTWLHALLEAHHRTWAGLDVSPWEQVHEELRDQFDGLFEEEKEMLGDLPDEAYRLMRGYLRFWGEVEENYQVATLDDGTPAVEFVLEVPLTKWGIEDPFKGRVDLLVEDLEYGGLWVWDHKWVKSVPTADERMMSPQNVMYTWGLRKMGYDVRGFLYNYGRTKPPAVPRLLKAGTLSMAQRMDTDYYTYLSAIKEVHGEMWKQYAKAVYRDKLLSLKGREALWYRRERIPVEPVKIREGLAEFLTTVKDIERRSVKHPPRSYFYTCKFGCEYHDICCAEFAGLDIEPLIRSDFTFEDERYTQSESDLLKE
jgi:hypothetical protein